MAIVTIVYEISGDGLDVLQLLFLRYSQGCVNSCHHLLTPTGINCCVLNFSCLVPHRCRPVASVYLRLKRNLVSGVSASFRVSSSVDRTYRLDSPPIIQGLSVPFACVGSGDPVRVLRLYTTNTLDVF